MRLLRSFLAFSALLYLTAALALTPGQRVVLFSGVKPLVSYDLTASNTLPAGISYSATSLRTVLDSNGFITYAPNEQFLNNASPATQNVTTKASNYVLWCNSASTGTITLTGTSTAGPLTCTTAGANLAFAPTAGTLTLTVGGTSVTRVVLAQVTYETTLRPQDNVTVASSAYYGPAFDSNYPSAGYQGLRIEEQRTNLATYSQGNFATQGSRFAVTVTDNNAAGPEGPNTASTVADTSANSFHGLTPTSISFTTSNTYTWGICAKTGTTNLIQLTGGTSAFTGGGYADFDLTAGTVTAHGGTLTSWGISTNSPRCPQSFNFIWIVNPATATVSDQVYVMMINSSTATRAPTYVGTGSTVIIFGWQAELGSNPTSYIPTGASAVTRSADIAQATRTLAACYKAASMSAAVEFTYNGTSSPEIFNTSGLNRLLFITGGVVAAFDNSVTLSSSVSVSAGTIARGVISHTPAGRAISADGNVTKTDGQVAASGANVFLGSNNGSNVLDGYLRKIACWSPALPNNLLQQKSVVGPGPITWNLPPSQNFLHASDTGSQILNSGDGLTPIMVN